MALKDKLKDLSKGLERNSADEIVTDWAGHIKILYDLLASFLQEYITEGLVSISYNDIMISEDAVPPYIVPQMNIKCGKKWVNIVPVGRFVAGADGRVDMRNQDKPPSPRPSAQRAT